jgi:hypothetical protein
MNNNLQVPREVDAASAAPLRALVGVRDAARAPGAAQVRRPPPRGHARTLPPVAPIPLRQRRGAAPRRHEDAVHVAAARCAHARRQHQDAQRGRGPPAARVRAYSVRACVRAYSVTLLCEMYWACWGVRALFYCVLHSTVCLLRLRARVRSCARAWSVRGVCVECAWCVRGGEGRHRVVSPLVGGFPPCKRAAAAAAAAAAAVAVPMTSLRARPGKQRMDLS